MIILQGQGYYLKTGVLNTSLYIKHLSTPSILQIPTPISKRNIRIVADPNALVRFNRHSELQKFYNDKIKSTFSGDASYAPEIEITTNYIVEIPRHVQEYVFGINIWFWRSIDELELGDLLVGNVLINWMQQSLQHIIQNNIQIIRCFRNNSDQWLSINKIKWSCAQTFENKFHFYPNFSQIQENLEYYQIKGYLLTLKGIELEDVMPLVTDSIWHMTLIEHLYENCVYLPRTFHNDLPEALEIWISGVSALSPIIGG